MCQCSPCMVRVVSRSMQCGVNVVIIDQPANFILAIDDPLVVMNVDDLVVFSEASNVDAINDSLIIIEYF